MRHVPAKYYIRPESDDEDETPKQSVRPVPSHAAELLFGYVADLRFTGQAHEGAAKGAEEGEAG